MTHNETWAIVGLGWLGQALANHLTATKVAVWGTHRADFEFSKDALPDRPADVWVFNTPPLTDLDPAAFVAKVGAARGRRVIFVSSTSVYGDAAGRVDEATPAVAVTPGARWLRTVEGGLRTALKDRLVVVRPGGLIGGERHPVFPLSRRGSGGADAPVNLIHREDLIDILIQLGTMTAPPAVINAVAPHHPPKSAYYGGWASMLRLAPIKFDGVGSEVDTKQRIVESRYLPDVHPKWRCPRLDYL